jgi:hypothetical protein
LAEKQTPPSGALDPQNRSLSIVLDHLTCAEQKLYRQPPQIVEIPLLPPPKIVRRAYRESRNRTSQAAVTWPHGRRGSAAVDLIASLDRLPPPQPSHDVAAAPLPPLPPPKIPPGACYGLKALIASSRPDPPKKRQAGSPRATGNP